MSNRSVITLRVASELKGRLARLAENEGVSMNQLISYFLTESVTAMEMRQRIEARMKRIEGKSVEELQAAALAVFDQLREQQDERDGEIDVPEWDRWPENESNNYDSTPTGPKFALNDEKPVYNTETES